MAGFLGEALLPSFYYIYVNKRLVSPNFTSRAITNMYMSYQTSSDINMLVMRFCEIVTYHLSSHVCHGPMTPWCDSIPVIGR